MGTTDSNGVWYWDENDIVAPIHTALNLGQANLSGLIPDLKDGTVHYVANVAARTALVATFAPSATRPLYVHRGDGAPGGLLEVTTDGTTWRAHYADVGRTYTSTNTGGGALTTAWTAPSNPASLALPAGTYMVSASLAFTLSPSAPVRIDGLLWMGSGGVADAATLSLPVAAGVQSQSLEWTRRVVLAAGGTLTLRGRTSAAGGTQNFGLHTLTAVRAGN